MRVSAIVDAELLRRLVVGVLAEHRDQVAGVVQLLVEGADLGFQRERSPSRRCDAGRGPVCMIWRTGWQTATVE